MSPSLLAMAIIFGIVVLGSALAFYAGAHYRMDLEQWTVAGRGFGLIFVWLLMAGEIYTTFSFLGASGWAYSRGGPALYIVAYGPLAYVFSFFILPPLCLVGKKFGLQTQSDFFQQRYGSKTLTALVAIIGVLFIIPYLQLQLTGLGIIVQVASYEGIGRVPAMVIASALVAAFVFASGLRAAAWVSVLKDFLMLFAVITIAIAVPHIHFGGIAPMFLEIAHSNASHLVMPGTTKNLGHSWYISTVLLTSLGFYMWPHAWPAVFSAKSADTLRRNAVIMPLYGITLPLVLIVGFAAIRIVPGLSNGDLSLLTVVRKTFPAWFLGVIGGAGALTAMVPAAILIQTAATLFAKNFYRPLFAPGMSDDAVTRLARVMVIGITLIALFSAIYSSTSLVALLLLGYAGVTQFLPGVLLGIYSRRVTRRGVFIGIASGIAVVTLLITNKRDPFFGLNAGFIALTINFLTTFGVSLLSPAQRSGLD